MTFTDLDRRFLITPKLLYFAAGSVYYAFAIFRIGFCKDYFGFSTVEAGDIAAALSLTGFLFMTVWSSLADFLKKHRLILALLGLLTTVVFELCLIKFRNPLHVYFYALGVFSVFGIILGGILPLTDYQVLKLLTEKFNVSKSLYGRQRMMGTVSYGLTSYLVGELMDYYGAKVLFVAFPIFSAIFVAVLLGFGYPDGGEPAKALEANKPTSGADLQPKEQGAMSIFTNPWFLLFLAIVFITGCGRQILQVYLPVFLKETMHLTQSQAGKAVISSTVFSVVFMFIGAEIISFFGVYLMLVLGMVTMAIRLGCYMFIPHDPKYYWMVYCIELLNGVAFSFTHLAGVKIAAESSPKGLEATSQAIYTSFYMQLPAVVVSFAGGRLYQKLGPVEFFGWSAKITLFIAAFIAIVFVFGGKIKLFSS